MINFILYFILFFNNTQTRNNNNQNHIEMVTFSKIYPSIFYELEMNLFTIEEDYIYNYSENGDSFIVM